MKKASVRVLFMCPQKITETHLLEWLQKAYDLGQSETVVENFRICRNGEIFQLICDEITYERPQFSFGNHAGVKD